MRSCDITDRIESLLECARMTRKDEDSAKVLEPAHRNEQEQANAGINFLKAEESETTDSLNHIIEKIRSQQSSRRHGRRIDVQVDLDPAVSSFGLDLATVGSALANLVCEAIDQSPEGFVRIETRLADDGATLLLIRNHDFPIQADETGRKPDAAAVNVARQDSTDVRLFVVMSMTVGYGGTISFTSRPDGLGVAVSYGFQRHSQKSGSSAAPEPAKHIIPRTMRERGSEP